MNQQDKNRAVSLGIQESFSSGKPEQAIELLAPDMKAIFSGKAIDKNEWLAMGKGFLKAFPDGRHEWTFVEAVGDYVLLCGFFTGTHRGDFNGIPATGKTVRFSLTLIDKLKDGKVIEHRGEFDSATMMRQLME
jgi:predicted ester cyclase